MYISYVPESWDVFLSTDCKSREIMVVWSKLVDFFFSLILKKMEKLDNEILKQIFN